jgi:hypothetical protein
MRRPRRRRIDGFGVFEIVLTGDPEASYALQESKESDNLRARLAPASLVA